MTKGQIVRKVRREINRYDKFSQANLNAWLDCFVNFAGEALNYIDEKQIDDFIKLLIKSVQDEKFEAVLVAFDIFQEMQNEQFLDEMIEFFLDEAQVYIGGMSSTDDVKDFFARVFMIILLYRDKARAKELEEKAKKKLKQMNWSLLVAKQKYTVLPQNSPKVEEKQEVTHKNTTSTFLEFFTGLFGRGFGLKSILLDFKDQVFGFFDMFK